MHDAGSKPKNWTFGGHVSTFASVSLDLVARKMVEFVIFQRSVGLKPPGLLLCHARTSENISRRSGIHFCVLKTTAILLKSDNYEMIYDRGTILFVGM